MRNFLRLGRPDYSGSGQSGGDGGRIPVINGLRGIAIVSVVFYHVIAGRLAPSDLWLPIFGGSIPLSPLLTNGWTGVNLFFILSGFVLFLPRAAIPQAMSRKDDRLAFYRRRFFRLMPLFYIAVISQWTLSILWGPSTNLRELFSVLSLDFIVNPHTFGPSFNVALWSIGDEIAFSLMFPFLVLAQGRLGVGRWLTITLLVSLAVRCGGILCFPAPHGVTFNSDAFMCRIDEFVLGIVLARIYREGRLPQRPGLYAAIGLALVLIAWLGFDLAARQLLPPVTRAVLNNVLDAGFCAIVLAVLVPGTRLAMTLSWPPLQVVGMMCYSIYIWHLPLLNWLVPDHASLPAARLLVSMPPFLATTVVVSTLSYRFIEFGRVRDWRSLFLLRPPAVREA